jgi:hypothetical protein
VNSSSGLIIEKRKIAVFEKVFDLLNQSDSKFIDPAVVSYKNVSVELIDLLMEMFMEFEEGLKPWEKSKFVCKCNEAY